MAEDVVYLVNGFSPSMLSCSKAMVYFQKIDSGTLLRLLDKRIFKSFIGHQVTADALSTLIGAEVPFNRANLKLSSGEMIIFTLNSRLPEGATVKTREELEKIGYSLWYAVVECGE